MTEIIPAILTESDEEFVRQVHILERAGVRRVHLDICDGIFVPRRTIKGYEQLRRMQTDLVFDVHLMVAYPERHCAAWCDMPHARSFIVHVEATDAMAAISTHARMKRKFLGGAINPETALERLERVAGDIDFALFMTVHPGRQGQAFVPQALERLTRFHDAHPGATIMVDGGVTPKTAPACVRAGASSLVSGSFVMRSSDPARALGTLADSVRSL